MNAMPTPAATTETVKEDAPKGCGCVQRMNDALRETYGGGKVLTNLFNGRPVVAVVQTGKVKGKLPTLIVSFCPFCGLQYGD